MNNIRKILGNVIANCFVIINVFVFTPIDFKIVAKNETNLVDESVFVSNLVKQAKDEDNNNLNSYDVGVNAKKGAILIDARTNDVLYSNDSNIVSEMASTTKIMTALLAIENIEDLDTYYEVNEEAIYVEGSSMNLAKGDSVNMRGLLIGLMLPSGNDAANEIAIRVVKELIEKKKIPPIPEDEGKINVKKYIAKFLEIMNDKAKELNLTHTKFCSPSGLGPKDVNYSKDYKELSINAKELALLTSYAMRYDLFNEICGTKRKAIEIRKTPNSEDYKPERNKENRTYINHNKMMNKKTSHYYDLACGVKTGFTREAGRCLVAAAQKDDVKLIAVVLDDAQHYDDCRALFEYGFRKYKKYDILDMIPEEDNIKNKEFKVIGVEGEDKFFKVIPRKNLKISLMKEMCKSRNFEAKIKSNVVYFNVYEGEKVGEIEYYMDGVFLGKTDLLADRDVIS